MNEYIRPVPFRTVTGTKSKHTAAREQNLFLFALSFPITYFLIHINVFCLLENRRKVSFIIKILICRNEEEPSNEKKSEQKNEPNEEQLCDVDNEGRKSDKDLNDKNSDENFESKMVKFLRIKKTLEDLFQNRRHDERNSDVKYLDKDEVIIHLSA